MENKIKRLLDILNKYSINELNKIYRDKEVELETESLTRFPDVKWSDSMRKKIVQQAKRKRISDGRRKYILEQIKELNNYNVVECLKLVVEDLLQMFKTLNNSAIKKGDIKIIHIEFSGWELEANIQAYGHYEDEWHENELGGFQHVFQSAKYWKELNSKKFHSMSELLEIIDIENEEYPLIFEQIRELRVFLCLKLAMNEPQILTEIKNGLTSVKIEVGMHDNEFYTIYEN